MSIYFIFWILWVILGLVAYVVYFRAIFRGETKPHLYTWMIWGILWTTASIISFRNGGGWWILVPVMMGILNTTLAIIAFFYGEKHISQKDKILLWLCCVMFVFWLLTKHDLWTMIIACLIESVGFYFTWKKSYKKPYQEDLTSYIIWTFEFLFAVLAIEHISVINWLYPSYLFLSEGAFIIFLLWRRKVIKK